MSLKQIGMVRKVIHVKPEEDINEAIVKFINNLDKDRHVKKFKRLHERTRVELRVSINILEATP
jgi:hypothetical protein